jgi:hypothetical protein
MTLEQFHPLLASLRRVHAITRYTRAAMRRFHLGPLLVGVAVTLALAAHWLRGFRFGAAEIGLLAEFGFGVIGFAGTVGAVLLTSQTFFNELASGTLACVLSRPVRRGEYVVGMVLGLGGVLALFCAVLGLELAALTVWRAHELGVPGLSLWGWLAAGAVQWMKLTLIASLVMAVNGYAGSALFASSVGIAMVVIGHLRPFATGSLEWLRVWPNLGLFEATAYLAGRPVAGGVALRELAIYWALACAWLSALATYALGQREP